MRTGPWLLAFVLALSLFAGLCWLDMRPAPTFQDAMDAGDFALAKTLISSGVDVDEYDAEYLTPLMRAARDGTPERVQFLINAGASVNRVGINGNTALHFAALRPNARIAQLLINAGADVNVLNAEQASPFCLAVQSCSASAEVLIAAGALPDKETCVEGNYLFCAARAGNIPVLSAFIKSGVDLNAADENGATALHYAINRGHMDALHILLDSGADTNLRDRRGWTALHHAVRCDIPEAVVLLIEHKADPAICDEQECTPLQMAARLGREQVFEELVRCGADFEKPCADGQTVEQIATTCRHPAIVSFIQSYRNELRARRRGGNLVF